MEHRALADIADVLTGSSPDRRVLTGRVNFIQIKDLDPAKRALTKGSRPSAKRAVESRAGDVLLAARGGQAVIVGSGAGVGLAGGFPTLDVYLIRPDMARVDPAFLVAWLTFEPVRNTLQASTTGALIPRIPIAVLKELRIPLPPMPTQQTVGTFFSATYSESALMQQLLTQTQQLRTRQLAAAFASLES